VSIELAVCSGVQALRRESSYCHNNSKNLRSYCCFQLSHIQTTFPNSFFTMSFTFSRPFLFLFMLCFGWTINAQEQMHEFVCFDSKESMELSYKTYHSGDLPTSEDTFMVDHHGTGVSHCHALPPTWRNEPVVCKCPCQYPSMKEFLEFIGGVLGGVLFSMVVSYLVRGEDSWIGMLIWVMNNKFRRQEPRAHQD